MCRKLFPMIQCLCLFVVGYVLTLQVIYLASWTFDWIDSVQTDQQMAPEDSVDMPYVGSQRPVKVIVMAYFRGGSSFAGELFNRNPDAFYSFEPVDGLYGHLYGTKYGLSPYDIYTNLNGSLRNLPQDVVDEMAEHILDILDCNMDGIPTEVLSHRFIHKLTPLSLGPYRSCLSSPPLQLNPRVPIGGATVDCRDGTIDCLLNKKLNIKPQPPERKSAQAGKRVIMKESEKCQDDFSGSCGQHRFFNSMETEKCRTLLKFVGDNRKRKPWDLIPPNELQKLKDAGVTHDDYMSAEKRQGCIRNVSTTVNACTYEFKKACKRMIRSVKTIRLNIDIVSAILRQDPDVKIVHVLRDPRAAAMSIKNIRQMSKISKENLTTEACVISRKMFDDVMKRRELEKLYPTNFLELKYESLADDMMSAGTEVYEFLGLHLPFGVKRYITGTLGQGKMGQGGSFSTGRKDSKRTSTKWMESITYRDATEINRACGELIRELGYDI